MEQTGKYNLSVWRRSKFLAIALVAWSFSFGQSGDSGVRNQTLSGKYPIALLQAHQANSLEKVGDFYHYLNLLSQAKDKDLQAQLKENIYTLFEDRNVLIDDFITDKQDRIPLSYLLDNIASKERRFSIKNEQVGHEFFSDFWVDSYTLKIESGSGEVTRQLRQFIYFRPQNKAFGQLEKPVLSVSLGPIE